MHLQGLRFIVQTTDTSYSYTSSQWSQTSQQVTQSYWQCFAQASRHDKARATTVSPIFCLSYSYPLVAISGINSASQSQPRTEGQDTLRGSDRFVSTTLLEQCVTHWYYSGQLQPSLLRGPACRNGGRVVPAAPLTLPSKCPAPAGASCVHQPKKRTVNHCLGPACGSLLKLGQQVAQQSAARLVTLWEEILKSCYRGDLQQMFSVYNLGGLYVGF